MYEREGGKKWSVIQHCTRTEIYNKGNLQPQLRKDEIAPAIVLYAHSNDKGQYYIPTTVSVYS